MGKSIEWCDENPHKVELDKDGKLILVRQSAESEEH